MATNAVDAPPGWRKAWPVVLAASIGYGMGGAIILFHAGLFIKPMREALGWSTSAVTWGPISSLVWGLCYPFSGWLVDRFGSRYISLVGSTGMAIGFLTLALAPISPALLYTMAAILGVFASMTAIHTYTRTVATWFGDKVGLPFGCTLAGSAGVTFFCVPLVGTIIRDHGWPAGFLALAAVIAFINIPMQLLFFRERPAVSGTGPASAAASMPPRGAATGEGLRDPRFWGYVVAFTIASIALGGFTGHLQPMLADKGIPLSIALSLGSFFALMSVISKIGIGIALDRLRPFLVAGAVSIIAGVGGMSLEYANAATSIVAIGFMVLILALGQGAEADFYAFFTLHSFGMRSFARLVGVLSLLGSLGVAGGGFLFGRMFDRYGNYDLACMTGGLCLMLSGVLIFAIGAYDRRRGRDYRATA